MIRFAKTVRTSESAVRGIVKTTTFEIKSLRYETGAVCRIQNAFPSEEIDGYAKRRQIAEMMKPAMPRLA